MARILFTNNAVATVASTIGSGTTVISVESGKGALFPNPTGGDYFKLVMEDRRLVPPRREIVHCASRTGDALTISRGQEGTTPIGFTGGFVVGLRMTAAVAQLVVDASENFSSLWLGVFAAAPTTDNDGNPLVLGAIYFNSVTLTNYAWDGAQWRGQLVPSPGVQARLFYVATAGQDEFGHTVDLWGNTLNLNVGDEVPVLVFKNGELLFLDDGTGTLGAYVVHYDTNRIELLSPAALNDNIEVQQLSSSVSIGLVDIKKLRDINLDPTSGVPGYIDGARATFKIRDAANNPVTPDSTLSLSIFLDGVPQEPGVAYTVATDEITFDEVLPLGTVFWGTFYDSMVA